MSCLMTKKILFWFVAGLRNLQNVSRDSVRWISDILKNNHTITFGIISTSSFLVSTRSFYRLALYSMKT
jgi:hypothetical protein